MVKLRFKTIAFLLMLIVSLQFYSNSFGAEDKILCVVGDDLITQKDFNEFLALAGFQYSAQYPNKKELAAKMEEIKKDALARLIDEKMILQEAKRQKIKVDERLVSERIDEINSQFPNPQDFEQALVSEGLTISDAKRKIKDQLLIDQTIEENVRFEIFVHPKEVTDYYKEHVLEFAIPESAKADSIFIAGDVSSRQAQDKVFQASRLLRSGEEFSKVAEKFSDGPSLGLVRRGQLKKEVEEAIFKLKAGQVSDPVKTEKGFFIFKLTELIPPQERPLSLVQNEVYQEVYKNKYEARFKQWLESIKKDVYVLVK